MIASCEDMERLVIDVNKEVNKRLLWEGYVRRIVRLKYKENKRKSRK